MINVSRKLTTVRKNKKMSINALSKLCGVSHTAISNYESGLRSPSIEILSKIASALDVDIDYLLGKTRFKDFEGRQLEEFERVITSIVNCSDDDIVKVSADIIESLSLLLDSPINMKRLGELRILNQYINLIKDIAAILEENNTLYKQMNKNALATEDIESALSDANNRFINITSEFYKYSNDLQTLSSEVLNSSLNNELSLCDEDGSFSLNPDYKFYEFKQLDNQCENSNTIDVSDFSDEEIKDIEKYINFIRYNRNNNL